MCCITHGYFYAKVTKKKNVEPKGQIIYFLTTLRNSRELILLNHTRTNHFSKSTQYWTLTIRNNRKVL